MTELIERIGICRSKSCGYTTLFRRVKVKLSRKYRVWPMPGVDHSVLMDPSEYVDKYETIKWKRWTILPGPSKR